MAVAHGSRDPRAAATVEALLDRVRDLAPGLGIHAAFLGHGPPSPAQALGALGPGPVVVLPLLLTSAYHSKTDIPAALAAAPEGLRIAYGATLGPDPLLIAAMERRLAEQGIRPDPGTAVVLAAAGSTSPAALAALSQLAERWRELRGWRAVLPAYASAASPGSGGSGGASPPAGTVGEAVRALRRAGARRVVVASYLLAPGRFAGQVRDDGLGAGAAAVSAVLGAAPELARLVLRRYQAAASSPAAAPCLSRAARIA